MLAKPICHLLMILLLSANRSAFSIDLGQFTKEKLNAKESPDAPKPKLKSHPRRMHEQIITVRGLSRMYKDWLRTQPAERSRKIPDFNSPEMMVAIASFIKKEKPSLFNKLQQADLKSRKLFGKSKILKIAGGLLVGAMGKKIFGFILNYIENRQERSRLITSIEEMKRKEQQIRKLYEIKREEFKNAFTELTQNYDGFLISTTEQTASLYQHLFNPKSPISRTSNNSQSVNKNEEPKKDDVLDLAKTFIHTGMKHLLTTAESQFGIGNLKVKL